MHVRRVTARTDNGNWLPRVYADDVRLCPASNSRH
jgi:hypothetical protein